MPARRRTPGLGYVGEKRILGSFGLDCNKWPLGSQITAFLISLCSQPPLTDAGEPPFFVDEP